MPNPLKYDIDLPDVDPNGICEDQTTDGAANLLLDGALCDLGTAGQFNIGDSYSSGIGGVIIAMESAGVLTDVNFTITGKNQDGLNTTETLAGPNANTIQFATYWSEITQIFASDLVGTNIEFGTVDEVCTDSVVLNKYAGWPAGLAVGGLSGTIQFDIQQTYDNIISVGSLSANWFNVVSGTDVTANVSVVAGAHALATRLKVDSYSSGAELQFYVSENPFR